MTDAVSNRPDARRLALLRSAFVPSTLDAAAEAISVASETERRFYVERVDDRYRWSFVHPGGGYPLLRITARFLRVDYTSIRVGFRTVADGVCVLCADPNEPTNTEAWKIIETEQPATREAIEQLVRTQFQ